MIKPITEQLTEDRISFLLGLTEQFVGGRPALLISEDRKLFQVQPKCGCAECEVFRAEHPQGAHDNIIDALHFYVSERLAQQERSEANEATKH